MQSISDYPSLQRLTNGVIIVFFTVGMTVTLLDIKQRLGRSQVTWSSASERGGAAFMVVLTALTAFLMGGTYPWWTASWAYGMLTLVAYSLFILRYAPSRFRMHSLALALANLVLTAALALAWADRMDWMVFRPSSFRAVCALAGVWYAYLAIKPIRA